MKHLLGVVLCTIIILSCDYGLNDKSRYVIPEKLYSNEPIPDTTKKYIIINEAIYSPGQPQVLVFDGCEYIYFSQSGGTGITHKGNCKNHNN